SGREGLVAAAHALVPGNSQASILRGGCGTAVESDKRCRRVLEDGPHRRNLCGRGGRPGVATMVPDNDVVFLFDVDNTLLDNDRLIEDLRRYLDREFGREIRDRYFATFER